MSKTNQPIPRRPSRSSSLLAVVRAWFGLGQAELALYRGVSQSLVQAVETGHYRLGPDGQVALLPLLLQLPPPEAQAAAEAGATEAPAAAALPALPPGTPPPAPDFFFVKLGDHTHKVHWAEVQHLEAGKNYVTLRVAGHRRTYPLRGSLSYVLDQLVPPSQQARFLRVNRRLALNAATITGFDAEWVYSGEERFENGGQADSQLRERFGA